MMDAAPANASFTSLENQLLVAMPQLEDGYFANSVIYLWRHNEEGALGLVVNSPIDMTLGEIFEQLGLACVNDTAARQTVLSGGPVETGKGFVLHDALPQWPSSLAITPDLSLTTSRDILADIAQGKGPRRFLLALGCAGWAPGQLEQELQDNVWFTCPATSEILFAADHRAKADMAAATLGFSMSQLTGAAGYS